MSFFYGLYENLMWVTCFALPFSIFSLVVSVIGIRNTQPVIILDIYGMYAQELGEEEILWIDIKSAKLRRIPRAGAFITLELHDETKYPLLGYEGIGGSIVASFGLSRLTITVTALEIPPSQILNEIQQRLS